MRGQSEHVQSLPDGHGEPQPPASERYTEVAAPRLEDVLWFLLTHARTQTQVSLLELHVSQFLKMEINKGMTATFALYNQGTRLRL